VPPLSLSLSLSLSFSLSLPNKEVGKEGIKEKSTSYSKFFILLSLFNYLRTK
jgi:hypothetical protein